MEILRVKSVDFLRSGRIMIICIQNRDQDRLRRKFLVKNCDYQAMQHITVEIHRHTHMLINKLYTNT